MKKLMIIMLMGIILLIPFDTHASDNGYQYGLPTYQLDQKIPELNNHTLREVFEESNVVTSSYTSLEAREIIHNNDEIIVYAKDDTQFWGIIINLNVPIEVANNYYFYSDLTQYIPSGWRYKIGFNISYTILETFEKLYNYSNDFISTGVSDTIFYYSEQIGSVLSSYDNYLIYENMLLINKTNLGISHLTLEQMDIYYDLYELAVKYELDNKEAVKDPGQYKHIFMSIYEGLTNLMRSMGSVWRFLTTPFVDTTLSDMDNLFSIDWSWDIFDVLRQWITNMAVWILQLNAVLIGTLFLILGIPIKVSILSLVFSDLVFVILGWIMIKSFII